MKRDHVKVFEELPLNRCIFYKQTLASFHLQNEREKTRETPGYFTGEPHMDQARKLHQGSWEEIKSEPTMVLKKLFSPFGSHPTFWKLIFP